MDDMQRNGVIGFLRSRTGLVLLGFLGVAAFYLATEHTAHLFSVMPFALLLLCPLMHLFMHGGHAENAGHAHSQNQPPVENDRGGTK